ncbi:MAG: hypothetical protein CMJ35_15140 [Phycisphaerae bacterium]|nr:hypothetical protein [Phycisphaerae bacterium]MBM92924.1 hypothetical protein [Phycisphaerae bacterium]
MRYRTFIGLLVSLLVAMPAMGQGALPVKQVVAPPSDIESGIVRLPNPVDLGETSRTLLLEIDPAQADADGLVDLAFPFVTGDGRARVVFLPAMPNAWVGDVRSIDARTQREIQVRTDAPIEQPGVSIVRDPLPWGDAGRTYPAVMLPADQREMSVRVQMNERVDGFVLIDQLSDRSLYTYTKQRRTLVGRPVTLASSLSDGSKIVSLSAIVRSPDGSREVINAGVDQQELSFTPDQAGGYAVQVIAEYASDENWPVMLSTQHLIEVESPTTPLGAARASTAGDQIELVFDDAQTDERTIVAAEVWGRSDAGMVPVCWLSRVCDAKRSLLLDPQLVLDAGVDPATIELRQVRVHDVDSLVPTQIVERMATRVDAQMVEQALQSGARHGPMQVWDGRPTDTQRGTLPGGHRLLLVHGYCSGGNPFTTSHFSGDIALFSDPNVSRSHDAFALEILNQSAPMKSFGVAAHSQGAMAALHLYTFYFSGLDWARGDRLIQSVGAPYQGTALAGNAAVLGDIFGFGCGENEDMSYTGSANWLSLIPTSSRQQVWYYTTAFEDRPFLYDYCNIITDLLLDDPDDGVIERDRGQLPGATSMGHVEDWCHTTGMRDPAQCTDASRNATINARARR